MKFFSIDSKFYQAMMSLGEMMLLNFCWIVGSLPLVTMGAATTAMYTVMGRRLRNEGSGTIVPFFKAWWSNLKVSTLFWVVQLIITACLSLNLFLPVHTAIKVIAVIFLILVSMFFSSVYPQIARFRNRARAYMKNAVILLVLRLKWVLLHLLLLLSPVILFLLVPVQFLQFSFIWLLFGFSALFYLAAKVARKVLQPLEEMTEQ